jgi:Ca2+-binding EF-hand superfamily protein
LTDQAGTLVGEVSLRVKLESGTESTGSLVDRLDQPILRGSVEHGSTPFPYRQVPDGSFTSELPRMHLWRTKLNSKELDTLLGVFQAHCGACWGENIDKSRFTKIIAQLLGPLAGVNSGERTNMLGRLFAVFDRGTDGMVSFRELCLGMGILCRGSVREQLWLAFNLLDAKGKGELDKASLLSFFKSMYPKHLKDKFLKVAIENIWKAASAEGRGTISFDDFLQWDENHIVLDWVRSFAKDFENRFSEAVAKEQKVVEHLAKQANERSEAFLNPSSDRITATAASVAAARFTPMVLENLSGLFKAHCGPKKTKLMMKGFISMMGRILISYESVLVEKVGKEQQPQHDRRDALNFVKMLFNAMDYDGDGDVGWPKFIIAMAHMVMGDPTERLQVIYDMFSSIDVKVILQMRCG